MHKRLISTVKTSSHHMGDPFAITQRRPELGLLAMQVISTFSIAEAQAGIVFAYIMESEKVAAARVFTSYTSVSTQCKTILNVAELKFPGDQYDILSVILEAYEQAAKDRNHIAHGVWGYSDDLPEAVLLAERGLLPLVLADVASEPWSGPGIEPNDSIWICERTEFEEALKKAEKAVNLLGLFAEHLSMSQHIRSATCPEKAKDFIQKNINDKMSAICCDDFVAQKLARKRENRRRASAQ